MDITTRNLFCLLRAGVLGHEEAVEPMSAWKWSRVYGLAMVHGLEAETWAGIELLKGQFFMRLPDALRQQWEQSAANARPAPRTPLTPRLAKKLDRLEDEADRPADARAGAFPCGDGPAVANPRDGGACFCPVGASPGG